MCSQCHPAAVLKDLMSWIKCLRNRVCYSHMSIGSHVLSALVRFEFLNTLWRYVRSDSPVPLPPDHELDALRRFTEHELASSSLILERMVLDLHERDFGRTSDPRSHTLMLYKARLSFYVLLTLLQRAAVLTAGFSGHHGNAPILQSYLALIRSVILNKQVMFGFLLFTRRSL